jgi:hypothetical protein
MGMGVANAKSNAWIKESWKLVGRMRKEGIRHVPTIPKSLPKGRVLVHNNVTPNPKIGTNGFRAWTQLKTDRLVRCHCDWAGEDLHGLQHYRVNEPSKSAAPNGEGCH